MDTKMELVVGSTVNGSNREVTGYVYMVDIDTIKPSTFNPVSRTSERYMAELRNSIQENGFRWWEPVIVTEHLEIGDGHRRYTVAKSLGIKRIPVMIVEGKSATQIWVEINGMRKEISSFMVAEAVSQGMEMIPDKYSKVIGNVIDAGGKDLLDFLVENKTSPSIFSEARSIAIYCDRNGDTQFIRKVIYWMIRHNMQQTCRYARKRSVKDISDVIIDAVESDRPLAMIVAVT